MLSQAFCRKSCFFFAVFDDSNSGVFKDAVVGEEAHYLFYFARTPNPYVVPEHRFHAAASALIYSLSHHYLQLCLFTIIAFTLYVYSPFEPETMEMSCNAKSGLWFPLSPSRKISHTINSHTWKNPMRIWIREICRKECFQKASLQTIFESNHNFFGWSRARNVLRFKFLSENDRIKD